MIYFERAAVSAFKKVICENQTTWLPLSIQSKTTKTGKFPEFNFIETETVKIKGGDLPDLIVWNA